MFFGLFVVLLACLWCFWRRARLWCFWPGFGLGLWLRLRLRLRAPSLFLVLLAWRRWLLWTVVVGAVSVAAALGFFLLLATFAFAAAVVVHDPHMLQEAAGTLKSLKQINTIEIPSC